MEEKKTSALNEILKSASLEDYDRIRGDELPGRQRTLCDYLNTYIGDHDLHLPDVIQSSLLSRDYAYGILNGNRQKPSRDRVMALCIAMGMNLDEVQRALELCNAGILYPKNPRDMAIIICINTKMRDVSAINEFLLDKGFEVLQTTRDV